MHVSGSSFSRSGESMPMAIVISNRLALFVLKEFRTKPKPFPWIKSHNPGETTQAHSERLK